MAGAVRESLEARVVCALVHNGERPPSII